jgi:hypothetical protein
MRPKIPIWLALLILGFTSPGWSQCRQYVTVSQSTTLFANELTVTFAGFRPNAWDPRVEPDLPPVCGPAVVGGNLFSTMFVIWGEDCVEPGSSVQLTVESFEPFPALASGSWANIEGDRVFLTSDDLEYDPDCNVNCVADRDDIASGTSLDLDGDGVPDECRSVIDVPALSPWFLVVLATLLAAVGVAGLRAYDRDVRPNA